MENINTLRQSLFEIFGQLKAGEIDIKTAAEMNNAAGKIINTIRVELEYAELFNKYDKNIPFMEYKK